MKIRNIKSIKGLRKTWTFCRRMGITQVMDVPRRKRGMTSSGKENECHSNVRLLTRNYGGSCILGFTVIPWSHTGIGFLSHSVWETPEGRVVDVTNTGNERDTTTFLPIAKYDPDKVCYNGPRNVLFSSNPKIGIRIFRSENILDEGISLRGTRQLTNKELKRTRGSELREEVLMMNDFPAWDETGGFTKPSLFTGKYFELREVM